MGLLFVQFKNQYNVWREAACTCSMDHLMSKPSIPTRRFDFRHTPIQKTHEKHANISHAVGALGWTDCSLRNLYPYFDPNVQVDFHDERACRAVDE